MKWRRGRGHPSSNPSSHPSIQTSSQQRPRSASLRSHARSSQQTRSKKGRRRRIRRRTWRRKSIHRKEPNDLQQFCKKSQTFNKIASKWHQKRHQIIESRLEGFPLRLEAFKSRKSKPKRLHKSAKRMPKRSHGHIGWPKGCQKGTRIH